MGWTEEEQTDNMMGRNKMGDWGEERNLGTA